MNTYLSILARKYAKAFVNLFYDKLSIESIQNIKSFKGYLDSHPDISFYLQLNSISKNTKYEVLKKAKENYNLGCEFDRLFKLLLKDKRISILASVLQMIIVLYEEESNILDFTFSSASKLTQAEQQAFKRFLEDKTNSKIIYQLKEDKSLIAGVKLYSDTLLWQDSILSRIKALKY